MKSTKAPALLTPLAEGQMVIIVARWVLVLAGLILILLDTTSVSLNVIRFEIMVILLLAVSNFYLVAQVLTKRATLEAVLYGLGLVDIVVISLIIIAQGGFESNVYTFYFPAVLAFSVAFPAAVLYTFLGATVSFYGLISLMTVGNVNDLQTLVLRLLMLAAVAVCGSYFAQTERNRRRALVQHRVLEPDPVPSSAAGQPS